MPAQLLRLPSDTDTVFADYAEFASHHENVPAEFVRSMMQSLTADELLRMEFAKQSARTLTINKE
jgi:hypothetical protein